MSYQSLLCRIDNYMNAIRKRRPLTKNEIKELDAYFRISTTYSSNALEARKSILQKVWK